MNYESAITVIAIIAFVGLIAYAVKGGKKSKGGTGKPGSKPVNQNDEVQ